MVDFYIPGTLDEALEIRADKKTIVFAGGTDLMVRARVWFGVPSKFDLPVLYIGKLEELKGVSVDGRSIRIGAGTRLSDIAANPDVPEPLRVAVLSMAAPAIRNMGTIGGNICNASPAGDTLPVLYAFDAVLELRSLKGTRELPIRDFITGPGKTALRGDEILTAITFDTPEFDVYEYRKVGTRKANALSKLSFFGLLAFDGNTVADFRAAFGAVAPTVVRQRFIEQKLVGLRREEAHEVIGDVVESYADFINPIDDQRSTAFYRKQVSLRLLRHFLERNI